MSAASVFAPHASSALVRNARRETRRTGHLHPGPEARDKLIEQRLRVIAGAGQAAGTGMAAAEYAPAGGAPRMPEPGRGESIGRCGR
jgi:hypothetical protein